MIVKQETRYIADDGTRFTDRLKCIAHEDLLTRVTWVMANLPAKARIPHGKFRWVNPDAAQQAALEILRLARPYCGELAKWIDSTIAGLEGRGDVVHPSWAHRAISDCCPSPLVSAWSRLYCIDAEGREWDQPYFAEHPDEGDGEWDGVSE